MQVGVRKEAMCKLCKEFRPLCRVAFANIADTARGTSLSKTYRHGPRVQSILQGYMHTEGDANTHGTELQEKSGETHNLSCISNIDCTRIALQCHRQSKPPIQKQMASLRNRAGIARGHCSHATPAAIALVYFALAGRWRSIKILCDKKIAANGPNCLQSVVTEVSNPHCTPDARVTDAAPEKLPSHPAV